jgi:hypothetical protein
VTVFKKYKRKPVVVEAVQWTTEAMKFAGLTAKPIIDEINASGGEASVSRDVYTLEYTMRIATLEGVMTARVGDYICRGVKGEYWPVKPDVFEYTNEPYTGDM